MTALEFGDKVQEIGWLFLVTCCGFIVLRRLLISFRNTPDWAMTVLGICGFMGFMILGAFIKIGAGGMTP